MPQVKTDVRSLTWLYGKAVDVVKASGRCAKCWATEFAFKCFGKQTEMYTFQHPAGLGMWVFDVDKARQLVGTRVDGEIQPAALIDALGETEPGHEFCLLKRGNAGKLPDPMTPAGILGTVSGGHMVIDGTHRGRLCIAAGVPMPVAVLTATEMAAVTLLEPPNTIQQIGTLELGRMADLFTNMDGDYFLSTMVDLLGGPTVADTLRDRGQQ